jgi:hypothetical protein
MLTTLLLLPPSLSCFDSLYLSPGAPIAHFTHAVPPAVVAASTGCHCSCESDCHMHTPERVCLPLMLTIDLAPRQAIARALHRVHEHPAGAAKVLRIGRDARDRAVPMLSTKVRGLFSAHCSHEALRRLSCLVSLEVQCFERPCNLRVKLVLLLITVVGVCAPAPRQWRVPTGRLRPCRVRRAAARADHGGPCARVRAAEGSPPG